MSIDLTNLSLDELKKLQKDVTKAIGSFEIRRRQEALAAAEAAAREAGFSLIPGSRQNPKFVVIDDPEVIGHLIAEGFPFVGEGFSKEP